MIFPCWHSRFVYFGTISPSLFSARAAFELIKVRSQFQFSCCHLLPCVRFSGAGCSCCDSVSCPLTEQLLLLQPAPSYLPWLLSYSHTFLLSAFMQLQLSTPNIPHSISRDHIHCVSISQVRKRSCLSVFVSRALPQTVLCGRPSGFQPLVSEYSL